MKVFSFVSLLISTSYAYLPLRGEISNQPCDWWYYWWTGVGDLTYWGVSNTGQGPIFIPASIEELPPYTGSMEQQWKVQRDIDRGGNAIYPPGSKQSYTFAAGAWVGSLYPIISDTDTVWVPNVSKCAYHCDLGAMKVPEMENAGEEGDISGYGLYFSDMVIPDGFPHAGNYLFKQPGLDKEDYQILWPFADTSLNKWRPEGAKLDPAKGDIVSDEDTYAVAGDWISPDSARVIWANPEGGPYQGRGMGIRMEIRTYSWRNFPGIFIDYKLKNMNHFSLKNVYLAYFMDNDIGGGNPKPQGGWDDMTGYDRELNLGYSYDSDGYEPGWKTSPGYIGSLLLRTPLNKGMTGFFTWLNDPALSIDLDTADGAKYEAMAKDSFIVLDSAADVRQLCSTGPYPEWKPEEEIGFTVAVLIAPDLKGLKARAREALEFFQKGLYGIEETPSSPPSPTLFRLSPNPSKGIVRIEYGIERDLPLLLSIYDVSGRLIEKKRLIPKRGEMVWKGGSLPNGIYFFCLKIGNEVYKRKLLLIK